MGIWPNGNPPSQKTPSLYEGVGSIPEIFKIYEFRLEFLSYIKERERERGYKFRSPTMIPFL